MEARKQVRNDLTSGFTIKHIGGVHPDNKNATDLRMCGKMGTESFAAGRLDRRRRKVCMRGSGYFGHEATHHGELSNSRTLGLIRRMPRSPLAPNCVAPIQPSKDASRYFLSHQTQESPFLPLANFPPSNPDSTDDSGVPLTLWLSIIAPVVSGFRSFFWRNC